MAIPTNQVVIARPVLRMNTQAPVVQQAARPRAYLLRPDVVRAGPQYPDVPRERLVEALRICFHRDSLPHP